jgi:polar amino acid transport system substrate-binding protein
VLAHPHPDTGQPQGASVDLARKLESTLGVPVEHVTFDAAGKVFEALKTAAWDAAFLAVDPVRTEQIAFTAPYVVIEGSYIVRDGSPYRACRGLPPPSKFALPGAPINRHRGRSSLIGPLPHHPACGSAPGGSRS